MQRLMQTTAPAAVLLIRLMVGAVFLSEGIQKFLFPEQLGAGRFLKIGLPMPELLGPFVGSFEIVCGSLVLLGLVTRPAVIPLIIIMAVALATTTPAPAIPAAMPILTNTPVPMIDPRPIIVAPKRPSSRRRSMD